MRKNRQPVVCVQCGAHFTKKLSDVRPLNFCSRDCRFEWMRAGNTRGSNCPAWRGGPVEKHCERCGATFYAIRSYADKARFCSQSCMQRSRSRESAGGWKGGIYVDRKWAYNRDRDQERSRRLSVGSHTEAEWNALIEKHQHRCLCCGRQEPEVSLTRDHIVPVSKGGTNEISNIQPLCRDCNCRKFTRTVFFEYGFEVEDMNAIPRELLLVSTTKIQYAVDHGVRDIPGVHIYPVMMPVHSGR